MFFIGLLHNCKKFAITLYFYKSLFDIHHKKRYYEKGQKITIFGCNLEDI